MPRPPRIYLEKALYYVTCMGDHNQPIFKEQEDYAVFMDALKKYKEQYKFKLFAYCLVPEHFHLLLELPMKKEQPKPGILSNIMHDLNSSYTKYFNSKYGKKGHLFRERYKSTLIEKGPYLLKLSAYIHLNPQRLNLALGPGQFPYSSYALYIKNEAGVEDFLKEEKGEILSLLRGESYEAYVRDILKEPDFSRMHEYLQRGILGTKDFQDRVRQAFTDYKNGYPKEKAGLGLGLGQKLAIISFVAISAGLSLTYVLKFTLAKKVNPDAAFNSSYKIPAQIKELLKDLENTQWQIRIVSLREKKVCSDVVYFKDGKFISREYSLKNTPPADYSLIIEDENKITWESSQDGPEGIISWRGEIKKGEMEGELRLRSSAGEVQDFSFVSINSKIRK